MSEPSPDGDAYARCDANPEAFHRRPSASSEGVVAAADRWNRGAWLFRDQTLPRLEILLDEAFRIPGTGIRFGIDGIIGLVPGLGDVLAGLLSLIIPLAAWIRGVPYVTLVRMAANLGIGVLVGSIPLFGDIFDIAWKANRRNYQLSAAPPRRAAPSHLARLGFLLLLGCGHVLDLCHCRLCWLFWLIALALAGNVSRRIQRAQHSKSIRDTIERDVGA